MKLFVWRNVLCDYTCGIAAAMANDVGEARQVLVDAALEWTKEPLAASISGPPDDIFDEPAGAYCYGGG